MPILLGEHASFLFLHIPKCGGSSVVDTFSANGYDAELQIRGKPPQECLVVSPQHQTCSVLKVLVRPEKITDAFTVVRNPYTRLQSEYNWTFRDVPLEDRLPYSEWVLDVLDKASSNPSYADNHFRPALDFLDLEIPTKIFRLEDGLASVIELYLHAMGSLARIPVMHKKKSSAFKYFTLALNLNYDALMAVNSFYEQDFAAFGYSFLPDSPPPSSTSCNKLVPVPDLAYKLSVVKRWRIHTLFLVLEKLRRQVDYLINIVIASDQLICSKYVPSAPDDLSKCLLYRQLYANLTLRLDCLAHQLAKPLSISLSMDDSAAISNAVNMILRLRACVQSCLDSLPILKEDLCSVIGENTLSGYEFAETPDHLF